MERRRRVVTWDEIMRLAGELCNSIQRPISLIMPVARGGLVPAALMSYYVNLPTPFIIDFEQPWSPKINQRPDVLVVDDVADSGGTFRAVRDHLPNALLVALFAKPPALDICEKYGELVPQDQWLVFPWAPNDEINR